MNEASCNCGIALLRHRRGGEPRRAMHKITARLTNCNPTSHRVWLFSWASRSSA